MSKPHVIGKTPSASRAEADRRIVVTTAEGRQVSASAMPSMAATIADLLTRGKGILAADESLPTIGRRFAELGIPCTEENRRAYRELLFTTPELGRYISGAILFAETMDEEVADGATMPEALARRGIIPGIKVDKGTVPLAAFAKEVLTEGLDGLRGRLIRFRELGARFTKWRAVFRIGEGLPSAACVEANATALAQFAGLSQEIGLVPIVEPEELMDGNHPLERCEAVMTGTLQRVFAALSTHRVVYEHMLLKTGMVLSGTGHPGQDDSGRVAEATRRCLLRAVPAAVPGIVFLSGGQDEQSATRRLDALCRLGGVPWHLGFSFGRALQASALAAWKGDVAKVAAAQEALLRRARCNGDATRGAYTPAMEWTER